LSINEQYIKKLLEGDFFTLAKCISLVENNAPEANKILYNARKYKDTKVIGITGAPGAGKSTLINSLLKEIVAQNKKVAVLSVDPSSPFNLGALLGDRIRMSEFYLNPHVYIRSLASRGALGGLHPRILEILATIQICPFDYILIETVGVGQSEIEIAGIADTTLVLVVPEGGDEVQTMKAGVMEIADIFIVNKCDRPQADKYVHNLKALSHTKATAYWDIPVCRTIASKGEGSAEVLAEIEKHHFVNTHNAERKQKLLIQKVLTLIQQNKIKDIDTILLNQDLLKAQSEKDFNLFRFAERYY
jgi:LAO/AO transport system kinase